MTAWWRRRRQRVGSVLFFAPLACAPILVVAGLPTVPVVLVAAVFAAGCFLSTHVPA